MKVVTIFNEKGGTGKTTLLSMFASWLAYEKKERVAVYDFDFPSYQLHNMRLLEEETLKRGAPDLAKLCAGNEFYPIARVKGNYTGFTQKELGTLVSQMKKVRDSYDGYLLLDFPGRFLRNDPSYAIMSAGLVDLVVFPVDTDRQSLSSALNLVSILRGKPGAPFLEPGTKENQDVLFVWNKENRAERRGNRDWYGEWDAFLEKMGIPVAGARIRDILIARRDFGTFGFIRSTVCWPAQNIKRSAPYLEKIFEEMKARLDGQWNEKMKTATYGDKDNEKDS